MSALEVPLEESVPAASPSVTRRVIDWWIRRNPAYLLSAVCMAAGAREFLVSPDARAGEVGLMVAVFGVLQAYKWAVDAIVVLLARSRRAPEDWDSLLLVAAVFWTGPIAATVELAAKYGWPGQVLTVVVCIAAMFELVALGRVVGTRISRVTGVIAIGVLSLLAAAPIMLRVQSADGTNDIMLYFAWWVLAAVTLLAARIPAMSAAGVAPGHAAEREEGGNVKRELVFICVTIAAAATQLIGMNYAFLGHASAVHAMPVVAAGTIAGIEIARQLSAGRLMIGLFALLGPTILVAFARLGFSAEFPQGALPVVLSDPWALACGLCAAIWFFVAFRLRIVAVVHLAIFVVVLLAWRMDVGASSIISAAAQPAANSSNADWSTKALMMVSAYLLLFGALSRRRVEAIAGLAAMYCALVSWCGWSDDVASFTNAILLGWLALVAIHVQFSRPPAIAYALVLGWLTGAGWVADFSDVAASPARVHSALIILAAVLIAIRRPGAVRSVGIGILSVHCAFAITRITGLSPHPVAVGIVISAFALLVGGAVVSWNKPRLLRSEDA